MKRLKTTLFLFLMASLFCFGQFKLPPLQFKYNALEPYVDSTTMYIHYNFHHAAYVTNLNKALEKYPELYKKDIVELIMRIKS